MKNLPLIILIQFSIFSLQAQTKDSKYYFEIGSILEDQGKMDSAIFYYGKSIELDTNNLQIIHYAYRGNLYFKIGRFKQALKDYNSAISIERKGTLLSIEKAIELLSSYLSKSYIPNLTLN